HAAHSGSLAEVDVGHRGHVVEDPGQPGHVAQLVQCDGLDLLGIGPRPDVDLVALDPLHVGYRMRLSWVRSTGTSEPSGASQARTDVPGSGQRLGDAPGETLPLLVRIVLRPRPEDPAQA